MPTTDVGDARVLLLRCRACHNNLTAASDDVAFRCGRCGRAWEIESGGMTERPSGHVHPPQAFSGSIVHLPYWVFPAEVTVNPRMESGSGVNFGTGPPVGVDVAMRRAETLKRVYVTAYSVHRPSYVGDWGQFYTRHQYDWEVRRGGGPEAPGANLASGDASTLATHMILDELDRACDLAALQVELQLGDPVLLAIPCIDLGDRFRCPWTRAELPARAIDDISEIRHAVAELEA